MDAAPGDLAQTTAPRLRLLGAPRLHHRGGTTALPPNDAALLAVLAIDGPSSRQAMAELLWPDSGDGARNNLRQRLSRWRSGAGLVLQRSAKDLLALPPEVSHDLQDLEARLAADPQAGSHELLGNLRYDHNPRLASWVAQARAAWRAQRGKLLADAAERHERAGRLAAALPYATRLAADEPLAEHAHRRAMRLHYLRGDRSAALAAFDACVTVLATELGVRPSTETGEMARLIERSATLPATPLGPANPPPMTLLRPPRIVGREAEWQALLGAQRAGQIALLRGEAGIGKSRLLGDFAAASGPALVVGARPGDAALPYEFLVRVLRDALAAFEAGTPDWALTEFGRLLPERGAAPPGRLEAVRLRQAVSAAFRHWHAAGLAVLAADDLHFADAASLELLLACAAEWSAGPGDRRGAGPAVLLAVRSAEVPEPLARWVPGLAGQVPPRLIDLTLGPLADASVARLVESLQLPQLGGSEAVTALARYTGGNPWFIVQTLVATLAPSDGESPAEPPTRWALAGPVEQLIERRLQTLSPAALRLARAAALASAELDASLAAEVLAVHPIDLADAWAELTRLGVVRGQAFAHDLWSEVARRSVPRAVAAAVHRGLAVALEARGAAAAHIAAHWAEAGDAARAGRHFRAAAQHAFAASRRTEELALLDQAISFLQQTNDRDALFDAHLAAVDAAQVVDSGEAVVERIALMLATAGNDAQHTLALLAQCKQLLNDSDGPRTLAPARQALALATRTGNVAAMVTAAGWLGIALAMTGDADASLALFDAHAPRAATLTDLQARLDFAGAHGHALLLASRPEPAVEAIRTALGLAEEIGDLHEAMTQANNLAICLSNCGRGTDALAAYDHALALWRRLGEPGGFAAACLHMHAGSSSAAAGRYGQALDRLQWALAHFRAGRDSNWRQITEHRLAGLYLTLGQPARARQLFGPLRDDTPGGTRLERAKLECRIDGLARREVGARLAAAIAALPAEVSPAERIGATLLLSAELMPASAAVAACRAALAEAMQGSGRSLVKHARIRLADALRRDGRHAAAADEAAAVVAEVHATGDTLFDLGRAEFWWLAHAALDAGGRQSDATAALQHGVDFVQGAARDGVPEAFLHSYLNRNPVNEALLAAAARRGRRAGATASNPG